MDKKYFAMAINEAQNGVLNKEGGPFGAVIIKNNEIISTTHNCVLKNNDPTAHAEVNAIREACGKLNTFNLDGCILYTTTEPCPMCLSACIWAGIKELYYITDRTDAAKIGFKDDLIYEYLKKTNDNILKKVQIKNQEGKDLLNNYKGNMY